MRNWLKTILFLSVFSPALISLAIVKRISGAPLDEIVSYGTAGVLGTALSFIILALIRQSGETIAFTAKKIESNDYLMLGVVSTYFVPFISGASSITMPVLLCLIIGAGTTLWFVNSLPPHPILRVLKYRFYKVESGNGVVYTLIAQRELLDPRQVRRVKRISSAMLVEIP